jgi:chaperonin cofactor prefoldin
MALPKQVQAQLAEVEELEKALSAREMKPKTAENEADTEVDGPDTEAPEALKPDQAKPADTSPTDVADDFKQKYDSLRGKYDAEVPRLNQQVRDLTDQLNALKKQLEKKVEAPTKPKEKVSYVTDADRAEFGEELIDVQRRVAKEVAQDYEDRLETQAKVIEELRSQVANTGNRLGEMSFAQRLNALVPDFAQIDQDKRWIAWLDEYDPILRGPRRVQAKAVFDAGDAEAVAHYVNLWKSTFTQHTEPTKNARQSELEKQVTPNRSANSANVKSTGRDAKIYSEREVNGVWQKIRTLNTRGQYDDAAKLEAEITAAYLEGRVR